jgi:hypothetical protein
VSGQLHTPTTLPLRKEPSVPIEYGLDDMQNRKFLTLPGFEIRPSVVQPVASRYNDYAITALVGGGGGVP